MTLHGILEKLYKEGGSVILQGCSVERVWEVWNEATHSHDEMKWLSRYIKHKARGKLKPCPTDLGGGRIRLEMGTWLDVPTFTRLDR